MRTLTALATASLVAFAASGCQERENMRQLPDRGGHAYRTAGAELVTEPGAKVPRAGEMLYYAVAGDNLKKVSERFTVTVDWIIRRNDLQSHILTPGQPLVVPKPEAGAAAAPAPAPAAPAAPAKK